MKKYPSLAVQLQSVQQGAICQHFLRKCGLLEIRSDRQHYFIFYEQPS